MAGADALLESKLPERDPSQVASQWSVRPTNHNLAGQRPFV